MNKQKLKAILRKLKTPELWEFYKLKWEEKNSIIAEEYKEKWEKNDYEDFYLKNREILLERIMEDFYIYSKYHRKTGGWIFNYASEGLIKTEVEEFIKLKGSK